MARPIKITQKAPRIIIKSSGARGIQGERGQGIPDGGMEGQILVKNGNDPYDYRWETGGVRDANFITDFTTSSTVPVNHNLNKYPSVTVIDSAGDEVIGEVYHVNTSQLIVRFNAPFSGRVTCN